MVGLGLFMLVLAARGELALGGLPWLLPALGLQLLLTAGLALLAATTQVFVRDLAPALGVAFLAWFYATPIVYPLALVPDPWRAWLALNPLAALVGLYRAALLGLPRPGASELALLVVCAVGCALVGARLFRHLRPAFADEV
jgi:lipopolysaccharide transport system permease protein